MHNAAYIHAQAGLMPQIHPSAVVSQHAQLADDVAVGPHAVISDDVVIGAGCIVGAGCMINGPAQLGEGNKLYGHCSIGGDSQDKKHTGGGRLVIGSKNTFREFTTVNRATGKDDETVVGSGNLLMAYAHVAHDCTVGDDCVIANAVQIGGHVEIGNRAIIGGAAVVHQHCRIGTVAIIGGATAIRADVPPYMNCTDALGRRGVKINKVGLERFGMTDQQIAAVEHAWRVLYRDGLAFADAAASIGQQAQQHDCLRALAEFLACVPAHGIVRPRAAGSNE